MLRHPLLWLLASAAISAVLVILWRLAQTLPGVAPWVAGSLAALTVVVVLAWPRAGER